MEPTGSKYRHFRCAEQEDSGEKMSLIQNPRRGFTLIELLIVLTIIAILTGMIFPVFSRAREKARQTVCISNERQVGVAVAQYTQDYDEILPSGTAGTLGRGWAGQSYPYAKSADIYKCPDDLTDENEGDPSLLIS